MIAIEAGDQACLAFVSMMHSVDYGLFIWPKRNPICYLDLTYILHTVILGTLVLGIVPSCNLAGLF